MIFKKITLFIFYTFVITFFIFCDFEKFDTKHARIFYKKGIKIERIKAIGEKFESAYQIIGKNLQFIKYKIDIYVYSTYSEIYYELVYKWGYSEDIIKYSIIPRMSEHYEMWITYEKDIDFIVHEYTHRVIEEIAGINSQINFKWFDEGIAEYFSIKCMERQNKPKAEFSRNKKIGILMNEYKKNKKIFSLNQITTEEDWVKLMAENGEIIYSQSYLMIDYLINKYGIDKIKKVLEQIFKNNNFEKSFQDIIGLSVTEFEKEFINFINNNFYNKIPESKSIINVDGDDSDWKNIPITIEDSSNNEILPIYDVREIKGVINNNRLYLLIKVEGNLSKNKNKVVFCINVDINNDGKKDYQIGFDFEKAWLWYLKGEGYSNPQANFLFIYDSEIKINEIVEFSMPIYLIESKKEINIQAYTGDIEGSKIHNTLTKWGKVKQKD